MFLWLHTIFLRQQHHVHQQPMEYTRHLHSVRVIVPSAAESVCSPSAAAAHYSGGTVHCIGANGRKRTVHSATSLQQHTGQSDMLQWLHAVYNRPHYHVQQQCVATSRQLRTTRGRVVDQPVRPVAAAA